MHRKSSLFKRNYMLLIFEGAAFMGGVGFFSSATVVPVFINMMTHSKFLVGLTVTLGSFFTYFFRLLVGPYVPYIRNHAKFTTVVMFICRPLTLLPAICLFLGWDTLAVVTLIVSYSIVWAADGIVVPPWSEVLANTIDEDRHGRLLGTQMLLGGFASIGAGALINIFLNNPAADMRIAFAWIFLFGGLLFTLSCFMMALTENAHREYRTGKVDFGAYYRDLPKYLTLEKDNTRTMFLQLILMFAGMCTPFIILFAGDSLGLSTGASATLILLQSIGTPIGGWMWGLLCDKIGAAAGLKLAALNIFAVAALPLAALALPGLPAMVLIAPVMFLVGISGGMWTCYYLYTVQAVRPESRPACLVLSSLISLPATFSGVIGGALSERFGFTALFAVCIVITLAGLALSLTIRPIPAVVAERRAEEERSRNAGAS